MAELGLTGAVRGKTRRTTIADPTAPRPADLVQRRFAPPAPNRLWVADLTYVSTWSGFAYVALVVDAYARRILGWRVAATMATSMVLDAIEQAIFTRQREGVFDLKEVVHHTDYAEVCVKPRMRGDGLRSWGVVGGFLGLTFRVLVSVCRISTSVEGDGDGYDGQWDRRGCRGGVAGGWLHGIDGWSVREDDQGAD
jgi:putative transposase